MTSVSTSKKIRFLRWTGEFSLVIAFVLGSATAIVGVAMLTSDINVSVLLDVVVGSVVMLLAMGIYYSQLAAVGVTLLSLLGGTAVYYFALVGGYPLWQVFLGSLVGTLLTYGGYALAEYKTY